eukprot:SAG22_NODE_808_length_7080_cov_4.802034_4_plen_663_part_00
MAAQSPTVKTESLGVTQLQHLKNSRAIFQSAEVEGMEEMQHQHRQMMTLSTNSKRTAASIGRLRTTGDQKMMLRGRQLMGDGGAQQKTDTDGRFGGGEAEQGSNTNQGASPADALVFFSQVFTSAGFIVVASMAAVAGVIVRQGLRGGGLRLLPAARPNTAVLSRPLLRGLQTNSLVTPLIAARVSTAGAQQPAAATQGARSATMLPSSAAAAAAGPSHDIEMAAAAEEVEEVEEVAEGSGILEVKVHEQTLLDWALHPQEVYAALRYKTAEWSAGAGRADPGGIASLLDKDDPLYADADYCDFMLSRVSRSFATVIRQLPAEARPAVCVFYLVLRALDTVEDDMSDSIDPARKLELLRQFHRLLVAEPEPEQPEPEQEEMPLPLAMLTGYGTAEEAHLLQNLPAVLRVLRALPAAQQQTIVDVTRRMGEGMATFVQMDCRQGTADLAEYNLYCHHAAGVVGHGLSEIFAASGLERPALESPAGMELANSMGLFLQKTNIIRDVLEDYVDGRTWWPKQIWAEYVPELGALLKPEHRPAAVACVNHMLTDALELAPDCLDYLRLLENPAVFRFCAVPQLMAIATQAHLYNNPAVLTGIAKIRKGQTAQILLSLDDAPTLATAEAWFCRFAREIRAKVDPADPSAARTLAALAAIEAACANANA